MNYMDIAIRASEQSNCHRKKTGAVVVLPSGGWVTGHNYIADTSICQACPRENQQPGEWGAGTCPVTHAEIDVLDKLVVGGGGVMYCTYKPCLDCAGTCVRAGIRKIIYLDGYRGTGVEDYLKANGVDLIKWE